MLLKPGDPFGGGRLHDVGLFGFGFDGLLAVFQLLGARLSLVEALVEDQVVTRAGEQRLRLGAFAGALSDLVGAVGDELLEVLVERRSRLRALGRPLGDLAVEVFERSGPGRNQPVGLGDLGGDAVLLLDEVGAAERRLRLLVAEVAVALSAACWSSGDAQRGQTLKSRS